MTSPNLEKVVLQAVSSNNKNVVSYLNLSYMFSKENQCFDTFLDQNQVNVSPSFSSLETCVILPRY